MTPLVCAKIAAVLSVLYGGTNLYQLIAKLEDVKERAEQFAAVAGVAENAPRLRAVRLFFYVGAPLGYLCILYWAQLAAWFLVAAAAKFCVSALLGLGMEEKLMRGKDYTRGYHRLARADAALNLMLTAAAVTLLIRQRY